jgi:hypothetical protein
VPFGLPRLDMLGHEGAKLCLDALRLLGKFEIHRRLPADRFSWVGRILALPAANVHCVGWGKAMRNPGQAASLCPAGDMGRTGRAPGTRPVFHGPGDAKNQWRGVEADARVTI